MGLTMKSKENVKIGYSNRRIANRRRFMEPFNVDECGTTVPRKSRQSVCRRLITFEFRDVRNISPE
jgi:hypothetical protein